MKLLLSAFAATALIACESEKHVFVTSDMAGFGIEDGSGSIGLERPLIVDLTPGENDLEYEIFVTRNYFTAKEYPKLTTRVVVAPETTAIEGSDFTLPETSIVFSSVQELIKPFHIVIHAAKDNLPRNIVLKMEYGHEDTCPVAERQADRMTINLNPQQNPE